jgi:formate hydrogenlyase subunit 3/multisubunit Na+/H+ antiporter MnhD subunit
LQFLQSTTFIAVLLFLGIGSLIFGKISPETIQSWGSVLPIVLMCIALSVILFAFSYRQSALRAWVYLLVGHFFILTAVLLDAGPINNIEIIYYASGVLLAFLLGYYCLHKIRSVDNDISLNQYHGYVYEQETTGFLFLLSAIGMLGFPVTAAFVGIDVLFTYVHSNQVVLIALMGLSFIFIELAAFRILLRIFLGPHKKLYHPVAFRSS